MSTKKEWRLISTYGEVLIVEDEEYANKVFESWSNTAVPMVKQYREVTEWKDA